MQISSQSLKKKYTVVVSTHMPRFPPTGVVSRGIAALVASLRATGAAYTSRQSSVNHVRRLRTIPGAIDWFSEYMPEKALSLGNLYWLEILFGENEELFWPGDIDAYFSHTGIRNFDNGLRRLRVKAHFGGGHDVMRVVYSVDIDITPTALYVTHTTLQCGDYSDVFRHRPKKTLSRYDAPLWDVAPVTEGQQNARMRERVTEFALTVLDSAQGQYNTFGNYINNMENRYNYDSRWSDNPRIAPLRPSPRERR